MSDDDLPEYWGKIDPTAIKLYFDCYGEEEDYVDPEAGDYVFKREVKIHAD